MPNPELPDPFLEAQVTVSETTSSLSSSEGLSSE